MLSGPRYAHLPHLLPSHLFDQPHMSPPLSPPPSHRRPHLSSPRSPLPPSPLLYANVINLLLYTCVFVCCIYYHVCMCVCVIGN